MRNHVSLMLVAIAMSGCAPQVFDTLSDIPGHIDLSTGIHSSVIEGSKQGAIEREYCYVDEPAKTFELVTDSGDVSIIVACFGYGSYTGRSYSYAVVEFHAQADHTYQISHTSIQEYRFRGIDVVDSTDNKRLVTRKPLEWERASAIANASQAFVFGIFDSAGAGDTRCLIDRTHHRKYFDPGELNFAVRCIEWSSSFGSLKSKVKAAYEARIAYDAKSSHSYGVSIQDKDGKCAQVMDVTTNPLHELLCEPTVALDELIGKTKVEICAGPKTSCREMTSCAEAMKYKKCGLMKLDGDLDGVPCNSLCK
jgi:hypothetical protein